MEVDFVFNFYCVYDNFSLLVVYGMIIGVDIDLLMVMVWENGNIFIGVLVLDMLLLD